MPFDSSSGRPIPSFSGALDTLRALGGAFSPSSGPNVWPLRPKGFTQQDAPPTTSPVGPNAPYGSFSPPAVGAGEETVPKPPGYYEVPSGFDPMKKDVPGHASYSGPRLNTEGALAGLKSLGEQNPTLQRVAQAHQGMTGASNPFEGGLSLSADNAATRAYRDSQLGQIQRELAPQAAELAKIQSALTGMHPAIQGTQEAEAQRRSYPAQAEAEGRVLGYEAEAEGRRDAATLEALQKQQQANNLPLDALIKGIYDYDSLKSQTPESIAGRQQLLDLLRIAMRQRGR